MNADEKEIENYMLKASIEEEKLRRKGINLVFIAGCEYFLFEYCKININI